MFMILMSKDGRPNLGSIILSLSLFIFFGTSCFNISITCCNSKMKNFLSGLVWKILMAGAATLTLTEHLI